MSWYNQRGGVLRLKRDEPVVAYEVWIKLNSGGRASCESKTPDEGKGIIDERDLNGERIIDVL